MRLILETTIFGKDRKRLRKSGKDIDKLYAVVQRLALGIPLDARHRPHPLQGDWKPTWQCHVEPDWLLIYEVTSDEVILVRSGSHADLFE